MIVSVVKMVIIAGIGGATWEYFAHILVGKVFLHRFVIVGLIYMLTWEVSCRLLRTKDPKWLLLWGAIFPYVLIVASIAGIWLIFAAIYYWWLFIPAGLLTTAIQIIAARIESNSLSPTQCTGCGYELSYIKSEKCPECGQSIDRSDGEERIEKA